MTTYYIRADGSDSNAGTGSTAGTAWRTPVKAYRTMGTDDVVEIHDTGGVWDGADARLDSRDIPNAGGTTNYHPTRGIFRVPTGHNPVFKLLYGTGTDKGTSPTGFPGASPTWGTGTGHSGMIWLFINPDDFTIDIQSGASLTFNDYSDATHPYPVSTYNWSNGEAETPAAIYVCVRSGRTGPTSGNDFTIRGRLIVTSFQGNGIKFCEDIQGSSIEPDTSWTGVPGDGHTAEISGCATGIRFGSSSTTTDGRRATTTLSAAGNIGDNTISVTSATGFSSTLYAGKYIYIDSGNGNVEWRKVTNVSGTTLTLGLGPYNPYPLKKSHSNGAAVGVMVGVIGAYSHANDKRGRSLAGSEFGSEGISLSYDCHHILVASCHSGDNWQYDTQAGYVDGGGIEFYQMRSDSSVWCTENKIHDCQGVNETGTGNDTTWADGNWRWDFNQVYAFSDQRGQHGGAAAAAPLALTRACPYAEIVHNSYWVTNGHLTDAGFRYSPGGSFGGTYDHTVIKDNLIVLDYGTSGTTGCSPVYNMTGNQVIQTGTVWNHNYIYYPQGYTGKVIEHNLTDYTVSQLATAQGALSQFAGDTWTNSVAPGVTAGATGNFTITAGSPLIGAASDGLAIGATSGLIVANAVVAAATAAAGVLSATVAPTAIVSAATAAIPTPLARDYFTRVGSDMGTADVGGTWTQTLQGTSTLSTDGNLGKAVLAQNANMIGASLLGITALNVDCRVEWETDKLPLTDIYEMFLTARGSNSVPFNDGYMAHVLVSPTLGINGNFNRVSSTGVRTGIPGAAIAVPGAPTFAPNVRWVMRFLCSGTNPTTLASKIWRKSDGEPTDWSFITTDSDAAHQVAGAVGFRFRVDTSTGGLPYTFSFDALTYDQFTGTHMQAPTIAPNAGVAAAVAAIGVQSETVSVNVLAATAVAHVSDPTAQIPSNIRHLTITMG